MANLTLRSVKGSPLTNTEMDGNFEYFTGSHAVTGSLTIEGSLTITGSSTITGSLTITGSSTITGSLTITGSSTITGSLTVTEGITGSILGTSSFAQTAVTASFVSSLLTIAPSNPLPNTVNGAVAFSSSGDFYFGSGSAWRKLTL